MDTKFQTSFIPKKPVVSGMDAPISVKKPVNLVSLLSTSVFVIAIIATGAVFGYERYLTQEIDKIGQELVAARSAFEVELFDQFIRLDNRMSSAKSILDKHVAASLFFDSLQNLTVRDVQFKDFDYRTDENGSVTIMMRGEASDYNSLALQSDLFTKNKYVLMPTFSDLDLNEKGNVTFIFRAQLKNEMVSHQSGMNAVTFMYDMNDNAQ